MDVMPKKVKVATVGEIPDDTGKLVEVDGHEIALFKAGGKVCATTNVCPHQGGPLSEGMIDGTNVICPWHAWVFDCTTGKNPLNPSIAITTYPVEVVGADVFVEIKEAVK